MYRVERGIEPIVVYMLDDREAETNAGQNEGIEVVTTAGTELKYHQVKLCRTRSGSFTALRT